jgi:hypothetical protein
MFLVIHILIALSSIAVSTLSFFTPSLARLRLAYGLVTATLASGTYLVISTHSPMLSSCVTGLIYTGFVLSLIVSAHFKLDNVHVDINR